MTPELTYFIKVNLALALLYGCYRFFFYRDTYFGLRRLTLLLFLVLAFSYPLFNMQEWIRTQEPIVEVVYTYSAWLPEVAVEQADKPISWSQIIGKALWFIYFAVAGMLFLRLLTQFYSILKIMRRSKRAVIDGVPVYLLPEPANPFSFFRAIFLYPSNHSEKERAEILTHECTHVRQWHSLDVLISECATIICWLNPFVWLLKREIRHNLEYLADNKVIHAGYDSKVYQFHLLGLSHAQETVPLYNHFNVLDLKKRITMMNKKRSSKVGRTKYLVFLPIAALLMLVSNIEAVARITRNLAADIVVGEGPVTVKGNVVDVNGKPIANASVIIKDANIGTITDTEGNFTLDADTKATLQIIYPGYTTEERTVATVKINSRIVLKATGGDAGSPVFTVVEEMPKFPGGDAALLEFIAKNVKYPVDAQQKGVQGRVIATFVVEKDGTVSEPIVVRGVDPSLDAEALRVISLFPQWMPGTQKGVPVRVKYTVPIIFRLTGTDQAKQVEAGKDDVVVVGYGKDQTQTKSTDQVFTVVEDMPKFPGGETALMEFVNKHIQYPKDAQEQGKQGRVICSFTVFKDGHIGDIQVVRGVLPSLDAEAVRVVSTMPTWTPGKQRGQAVNTKYTLPITFRAN